MLKQYKVTYRKGSTPRTFRMNVDGGNPRPRVFRENDGAKDSPTCRTKLCMLSEDAASTVARDRRFTVELVKKAKPPAAEATETAAAAKAT